MRLWGPISLVVVAAACGSFESTEDGGLPRSRGPHAPAAPGLGSGGAAGAVTASGGEAGAALDAAAEGGGDVASPDADAASEAESGAMPDGDLDAKLEAEASASTCIGDAGSSDGGACHFYAQLSGSLGPCFATFEEACACLACPTSQCHVKGGRLKIDFCSLKKKNGPDAGCDASASATSPSTVVCTDAGTSDAAETADASLD